MNINQFTIKSQEAIGKAQEIAQSHQCQTIESFHLLKGMILSDDYLVPNLMKKLGVNMARLNDALDQAINSQPRSSGTELYYSSEVSRIFNDALTLAKKMGDEYISIEHLLLAIFESNGMASQMLKDQGIRKDELEKAIMQFRRARRSTRRMPSRTTTA